MKAQTLLRHATGLNLSKTAADRAVRQRMLLCGVDDSDAYLENITPLELTQLIELVVVPESWLFRDAQAFSAAVEFIEARQNRAGPSRPARILSIPCAGGEEPYSMAMALRDAGVAADAFSIDAYDLSPGCVARAQSGIYGRNAFRAQDTAFRERYFTHLGDDDYQILPALRDQVTFRQGNLLRFDTKTYGRYYDVIFCRNLLIYFDKPTTAAAIGILSTLLADDGMMLAGYAEVPSFCQNGFMPRPYRQAFALQKESKAQPAKTPAPRAPARAPVPKAAAIALAFPQAKAAPKPVPKLAPKPVAPNPAAPQPAAPQPAAPEDLLAQARRLADLGQFGEAAETCHALLASEPEAAGAYFILGILNEQAGKMALAEDYWKRCIYLQPEHYEALCHLALLAEQNGNRAGAATLKARAARIYQRRLAP